MIDKQTAQDIREATEALHESVRTALERFTETTGIMVDSVDWKIAQALVHGDYAATAYYEFETRAVLR